MIMNLMIMYHFRGYLMPFYTYKYLKSGETFEVYQKMSDKELTKYNGKKVKKVPSTFGMNLKGDGFYKNDYKK